VFNNRSDRVCFASSTVAYTYYLSTRVCGRDAVDALNSADVTLRFAGQKDNPQINATIPLIIGYRGVHV